MTRRARQPRVPPPGRPRPGRIPSQAHRNHRGPKPPDGVSRALRAAVRRELRPGGVFHVDRTARGDAASDWLAALERAWDGLSRAARRGVSRVLDPARRAILAAAAPPGGRSGWIARAVAAIARAVGLAQGAGGSVREVARAGGREATDLVVQEHARLVEALSKKAGVTRYVWSTQLDERVRRLHRELEGTIQRWDDPPVSGTGGFRGHPGEPANCRCFPWPWP